MTFSIYDLLINKILEATMEPVKETKMIRELNCREIYL